MAAFDAVDGSSTYFRPGQLDYARVDMNKPGKRWFCTEDEAKAAAAFGGKADAASFSRRGS
jgi:hypothetical protein